MVTTDAVERQPDLFSVRQIVERTGYSRAYVYQLIHRGELRARRIGRSLRVPAADYARFLGALPEAEFSRVRELRRRGT